MDSEEVFPDANRPIQFSVHNGLPEHYWYLLLRKYPLLEILKDIPTHPLNYREEVSQYGGSSWRIYPPQALTLSDLYELASTPITKKDAVKKESGLLKSDHLLLVHTPRAQEESTSGSPEYTDISADNKSRMLTDALADPSISDPLEDIAWIIQVEIQWWVSGNGTECTPNNIAIRMYKVGPIDLRQVRENILAVARELFGFPPIDSSPPTALQPSPPLESPQPLSLPRDNKLRRIYRIIRHIQLK